MIVTEVVRCKEEIISSGSGWAAQLVEGPTLDFSSVHDLRVMRSVPVSGSALAMEPAQELSLSLLPTPLLMCSVSLFLPRTKRNDKRSRLPALTHRFIDPLHYCMLCSYLDTISNTF